MVKPQQVVFASNNAGKCVEVQAALSDVSFECVPQSNWQVPAVAETGLTFIENALIKARHASLITGLPALADDSGLVVDYLDGAPGIYSARFAGENATAEENNVKLLAAMQNVPDLSARSARFVCVMVYLSHHDDPMPHIGIGQWEGAIALNAAGSEGHGYDPVFYLPERSCTAAQLSLADKNKVSHRALALAQLQSVI